MKKLIFSFACQMLLLAFFFVPGAVVNADDHHHHHDTDTIAICRETLIYAADTLRAKTAPPYAMRYNLEIRAKNDFMFTDLECMANVLITIKTDISRPAYTLFHIHFSPKGEKSEWIPKTYTVGDPILPEWKDFTDESEWKTEWCSFIKSVYPQELNDQGCAE